MLLAVNAVGETRRAGHEKPIKLIYILNRGLQTALLVVFMLIVVACSGVPLFPGI